MYARLNVTYGWVWQNEDGTLGPFVIHTIEQYHGMITGFTKDGRKACRPATEFDALSYNGRDWFPTKELLRQVPQESRNGKVRIRDVLLPVDSANDP